MIFKSWFLAICLTCLCLAGSSELTPISGGQSLLYFNQQFHVFRDHELLTSDDLKHWTKHSLPTQESQKYLAYGNGTYVLGTGARLWTSSNLTTFVEVKYVSIGALIFDGSRFLVSGEDGVWSSTDGQIWQQLLQGSYADIATAAGKTIAVGASIAVSDGGDFQVLDDSPHNMTRVAALPGHYLVFNNSNLYSVSEDSLTWSHLTNLNRNFIGLKAVKDHFYILGYNDVTRSVDGQNWTTFYDDSGAVDIASDGQDLFVLADELLKHTNSSFDFIAFGAGATNEARAFKSQLVLFRGSGIWSSSNGETWHKGYGPFGPNRVLASEDAMIAFGNIMIASRDGVTWTDVNLPISYPSVIESGPEGFYAMTNNNQCSSASSPDGIHWTSDTLDCRLLNAQFNGEYFLSVDGTQLWRSASGHDWTKVITLDSAYATLITSPGSFMVLQNNHVLVSPDGRRFERKNFQGEFVVADGYWRQFEDWFYSQDGRSWSQVDVTGRPSAIWQNQVISRKSGSVYLDDFAPVPTRKSLIPWVVHNETWQSRVVLNNASDAAVQVDLTTVDELGGTLDTSLVLAAGQVYSVDPYEIFPGLTRYSLFIEAHGSSFVPVFQVNAEINGVLSPSQSGAIFEDDLFNKLMFPFMAATDSNALVLVETMPPSYSTEDITLKLLNKEGQQLASTSVVLTGRAPLAFQVINLFPDIELPEYFTIRAEGGTHLAGTSFIFNQEGQPSMASAFPIPK